MDLNPILARKRVVAVDGESGYEARTSERTTQGSPSETVSVNRGDLALFEGKFLG